MTISSLNRGGDGENVTWQVIEKLDEQRGYPRVDLDSEVLFRNASGQHCTARLLNIAPDGIQIRANVACAQILHPSGGRICPSNSPIVQAEITVPIDDDESILSVCSQLTYITTITEEPRCVIGLHFLEPRPTAQRLLDKFFGMTLEAFYSFEDEAPSRAQA